MLLLFGGLYWGPSVFGRQSCKGLGFKEIFRKSQNKDPKMLKTPCRVWGSGYFGVSQNIPKAWGFVHALDPEVYECCLF